MKKWCQVIQSAAPVTQNHLRKPEDLMLQNATPLKILKKSAAWPPNISDEHVSCTAPAMIYPSFQVRSSSNVPRLPSFLKMLQSPHVLLTFDKVENPLRLPHKTTLQRQKWRKHVVFWCALYVLTSKRASRHNGVHFLNISTSKSALRLRFFCAFWLGNVLRTTRACNFSSLIWSHGSAPAALASLPFHPPEPQIIGKVQCFTAFLPFRAPGSSFFWISLPWSSFFFSSLLWLFPPLLFHLSILSEVWLLNFLRIDLHGAEHTKSSSRGLLFGILRGVLGHVWQFLRCLAPILRVSNQSNKGRRENKQLD